MKSRSFGIKATIQVCLIVISFLLGGVFMLLLLKINPIDNTTNNVVKDNTKIYEKNSLASSVEKVFDAVVAVEGYDNSILSNTGTGFVYKTDNKYGYILTNEHVLGESNDIKVVFSNEKAVPVKVLGKDNYLDLAVLRVDKKYVTKVVSIGSSEDMNLGDTVFAVGSPLGTSYRGSVTSGILSGKDRLVSTTASEEGKVDWVMKVLQTDTPLNPGNSGGPLLNINGEAIGVCTMKLIDDNIEGMGFAIPIEYAMEQVKLLEKGTKIKWPVLGIGMQDVNANNLTGYGIDLPSETTGVIVVSVKGGSGAAKAGLQKKDVITKINNIEVKDTAYLRFELYKYKVGESVKVTYIRNGREKTVKVVLGSA